MRRTLSKISQGAVVGRVGRVKVWAGAKRYSRHFVCFARRLFHSDNFSWISSLRGGNRYAPYWLPFVQQHAKIINKEKERLGNKAHIEHIVRIEFTFNLLTCLGLLRTISLKTPEICLHRRLHTDYVSAVVAVCSAYCALQIVTFTLHYIASV